MDPTEAEDIQKRWQEYTEEPYKNDPHDPDNHDGVIPDLEPDILECEVKWALESITTNKASARSVGPGAWAPPLQWPCRRQPTGPRGNSQLRADRRGKVPGGRGRAGASPVGPARLGIWSRTGGGSGWHRGRLVGLVVAVWQQGPGPGMGHAPSLSPPGAGACRPAATFSLASSGDASRQWPLHCISTGP